MIEARTLSMHNVEEVAEWCGGMVVQEHDALDHSVAFPAINVQCGNEVRRASLGDTIVEQNGVFSVTKR